MSGLFAPIKIACTLGLAAYLCGLPISAADLTTATPEASTKSHKIALVEVPEPNSYGVVNAANEARFGGGLLNTKHGEEFTNVLHQRGFSISQEFNERLVSALTTAGFDVERIHAIRQDKVVTHDDTDADAILWVAVGAGYYAANSFADYIPRIHVRAVLLNNDKNEKKEQLYRQDLWYGSKNPLIGGIEIETEPIYGYGSFDKLMESNVQAGEGLLQGAHLISDRLAKEISALKH